MKKIFRARLYKEQGKTEEAYKTIEEVLLSQSQTLGVTFSFLLSMALKEKILTMEECSQRKWEHSPIHLRWENIVSVPLCLMLYMQRKCRRYFSGGQAIA